MWRVLAAIALRFLPQDHAEGSAAALSRLYTLEVVQAVKGLLNQTRYATIFLKGQHNPPKKKL